MTDLLDALLGLPPAALYAALGALAAVENLFPPGPADSAVAIGAFLAVRGPATVTGVFLATWAANVAGAAGVYAAARTAGRSFVRGKAGQRLLKPAALARIEALYARHGTWAIFLSRFIPGVRAVVPPFAGIAGLGAGRALVPVVVASGLWYGAVALAAATLVRNLEQIATVMAGVNRAALVVALVVALVGGTGLLVALVVRRRRAHD